MYKFTNTTQGGSQVDLPSEAVSINGQYLENLIPGYRTLSVSGRESLSAEVETKRKGRRDGALMLSRSYPERHITVKYQLICDSAHAFREAYNTLTEVLDVDEAQFIFADETDKYFIGTPAALGDIETGLNSIVSTIEIVCADPHKYAVDTKKTVYTASIPYDPVSGSIECVYELTNGGNRPVHPVITIETTAERDVKVNTQTGTGEYNEIQNNGPLAAIEAELNDAVLSFGTNKYQAAAKPETSHCDYITLAGPWDGVTSERYNINADTLDGHVITGSLGRITAYDGKYVYGPTSYGTGSGNGYFGPTLSYDVDAEYFSAEAELLFHVGEQVEGIKNVTECGCFQMGVLTNSALLAEVKVYKFRDSRNGRVRVTCNSGSEMLTGSAVFDLNDDHFTFDTEDRLVTVSDSKKIEFKREKKSDNLIRIKRTSNKLIVNVCGLEFRFVCYVPSNAAKVVMCFGAEMCLAGESGGSPVYTAGKTMDMIALRKWRFEELGGSSLEQFPTSCILRIDTENSDFTVDSGHIYTYGDLENNFEGFVLRPGLNHLRLTAFYSTWGSAEVEYPTVTIEYRERWL